VSGELELIAKLVGGGGVAIFAALVWWEVRSDRRERREDRQSEAAAAGAERRELADAIGQLSATLARLDERTAILVGEITPVEAPRPLRRERTPPRGLPTEYSYPSRRKPDDR
jgi:hypothetical protein